jgi:ubiquinone/menaquinone biosynthesis C-methylase UbiE
MNDDLAMHQELYNRYQKIAQEGDHTGTASDFKLRDLEISYGSQWISPNSEVLDVGCGYGFALTKYSSLTSGKLTGIDYSPQMIENGKKFLKEISADNRIDLRVASVLELPFPDNTFDVVTSHRCLMALLSFDKQKIALNEIHRVLKPEGVLVLMEGTLEGLARLNNIRTAVGLSEIAPDGADRLMTKKFSEPELLNYTQNLYSLLDQRGFGTYYFIGRVVQPLLTYPNQPSYQHPLNEIARVLEEEFPNLVNCGHLQGFALRKKFI